MTIERPDSCGQPARIGILLSGRGSNFEAIVENVAKRDLAAGIAVVISNRPDARGLDRASQLSLPAICLPSQGVPREEYDDQLARELKSWRVDLVCLAGFMRLLSPRFVSQFPRAILNIHPSLLPAFPGLNAQAQALAHGVKITGCTVHFVDEHLDAGPIVMQSAVPVLPTDTVDSLSARILKEEHRIYSDAIRIVLKRAFRIDGRRVIPDSPSVNDVA